MNIFGPTSLVNGLLIGFLFGFILQKSRVTKHDVIVGFLRLTDLTVLRVMAGAIIVAMIGVHLLNELGLTDLYPPSANFFGLVAGGLIFGAGMATAGYCPGTAAGALGEGKTDALVAMAGMVIGSALYAEVYPVLLPHLTASEAGPLTLPEVLHLGRWPVIAALTVVFSGVLYAVRKRP